MRTIPFTSTFEMCPACLMSEAGCLLENIVVDVECIFMEISRKSTAIA